MPLKVLKPTEYDSSGKTRASKRALAEAKYDHEWSLKPQQFDSSSSALFQQQLDRTKSLFLDQVKGKTLVELGCGDGALSQAAALFGANVTATDISLDALKRLEGREGIKAEKHFVPYTSLPDSAFDFVIAANLIAELPQDEYRLFFSELARLVKRDGKIIVSTPLDTSSNEALELFLHYAETELQIETLVLSYHRIYLRISPFLTSRMKKSRKLLLALENLTKLIYDKEGASHAIILAKRKPLFNHLP
jgi:2-polyprenyl-3-methyl-5-hydroxy-6-metoxy-1,4-benzoquinol methylase